jgi:hypothetical protein
MSVPAELSRLTGKWKGNNRLHAAWLPDPIRDSESHATVELRVNGQFLSIEYDWAFEGDRKDGVMIIGCDNESDAVQAVWTDSWHMSQKFMICDGTIDDEGRINVKGYYAVPDNPDWGWRTEVLPGAERFRIVMYNVTPDGEEDIAVEADYTRI